jgi:tRNA dimethylallyltransferase
MDIGTAKPSPEELSLAPHRLTDIVNPDENFSLAQYQQLAYRAIGDIQERQRLALLVGGSGQYIWSILEGWEIPQVSPDFELRRSLEERAVRGGKSKLYQELVRVDPRAAETIDPANTRRVIRALEVYKSTGIPFSQLKQKKASPFDTLIIGLTADRKELYRRIDLRVDKMMIEPGLVTEVKRLLNMGYDLSLPAMSGIGYRQIGMFLKGELALAPAIEKIKFETHRVARHQYAWFQLKDARIRWFDIESDNMYSQITALATKFIS